MKRFNVYQFFVLTNAMLFDNVLIKVDVVEGMRAFLKKYSNAILFVVMNGSVIINSNFEFSKIERNKFKSSVNFC